MTRMLLLPLLFVAVLAGVASADPIIVKPDYQPITWEGNAGQVEFTDLHGPIEWSSTERLRSACFWQDGSSFAATDRGQVVNCLTQTIEEGGTYRYTLDLRSFSGRCGGRVQPDTEWEAGSAVGLWLVVRFPECAAEPSRAAPGGAGSLIESPTPHVIVVPPDMPGGPGSPDTPAPCVDCTIDRRLVPEPVPEPASLVLLGLGLVIVARLRAR